MIQQGRTRNWRALSHFYNYNDVLPHNNPATSFPLLRAGA